jgi:hypothetical protein
LSLTPTPYLVCRSVCRSSLHPSSSIHRPVVPHSHPSHFTNRKPRSIIPLTPTLLAFTDGKCRPRSSRPGASPLLPPFSLSQMPNVNLGVQGPGPSQGRVYPCPTQVDHSLELQNLPWRCTAAHSCHGLASQARAHARRDSAWLGTCGLVALLPPFSTSQQVHTIATHF